MSIKVNICLRKKAQTIWRLRDTSSTPTRPLEIIAMIGVREAYTVIHVETTPNRLIIFA